MAENSLDAFQELIGYRFRNPQLLLEALTHSSFAQESSGRVRDNEQLEFLGDAVLNFLVSVWLVDTFPQCGEGQLTRARARLVAAPHLGVVAARLGLGDCLRLGRGEEKTGGRSKATLLVNALEALIAALFRDGGLETARTFIQRFIIPEELASNPEELFWVDYKSALQELLQAERQAPVEYRVIEESGPEHQKTFTVEVVAGERLVVRGSGGSKKVAEQQAARMALELLGKRSDANG